MPDLVGFDARYRGVAEYIVGITHRIWEERGVGLVYRYYGSDVVMHTTDGIVVGREPVVQDTLTSLAAFPGRRLLPDDVISAARDDGSAYSSHRIVNLMRHTGMGAYGRPTGRRVQTLTIADCLIREERIVEEWLVRDTMHAVLQLGLDPFAVAAASAPPTAQAVSAGDVSQPLEPGEADCEEEWARRMLHAVWNWRLLDYVDAFYAPDVVVHGPIGRVLYGSESYVRFLLELLALIPDARLSLEHVCSNPLAGGGRRVALRWTLAGTHMGGGRWGPPSGRPVALLGASHMHVVDGRVRAEWILFDELAALKQIYAQP